MPAPATRPIEAYPELERGRGLRFVQRETEAAYRAWSFERAIPFNRAAMWTSLISWVAALFAYLLIRGEPLWVAKLASMALPCVVLALLATYVRALRPWLEPLLIAANAGAGLVIAAVLNPRLPSELQTGTVMLVMFHGFAIQRISPLRSCLSVAPFLAYECWQLLVQEAAGSANVGRFGVVLLVIGYGTGFMISTLIDVASRDAFRLDRIIDAQRESLALERRRTEALLEQEVRYQVAERSRAMGEAFARTDAPPTSVTMAPGERFDARYKLIRSLGSGAMGQVYEVERITDLQRLALKVMSVSGSQASRFAREAEIGARIVHHNVVSIVDVGVAPYGSPFLVMELINGGALEDQRERFGDATWALRILEQVAAGLNALHEQGVVHRDLKPANILLSNDSATPSVKISDFGISRYQLDDDELATPNAMTLPARTKTTPGALTATGVFLGTPLYMAPEAAHGGRHVGARADMFAFGIIAYELLTGKKPFAVPPVLHAMTGQSVPVAPPLACSNLEPHVADALMACLAESADERPALKDVLKLLREAMQQLSGSEKIANLG